MDDFQETYSKTVGSLVTYSEARLKVISNKMEHFKNLSDRHKDYYSGNFHLRINAIEEAIMGNQYFIDFVVEKSNGMFSNLPRLDKILINDKFNGGKHIDTILRQIYREWSEEGEIERENSYKRIIDLLCEIYPEDQRENLTVLVPGSGLGRLVYDISLSGYNTIHNDEDMYMLIFSYTFLNGYINKSFNIYPWVMDFCNNYGKDKLLRKITIPKIDIEKGLNMIALAGDFHDVFKDDHYGTIDTVVTCFFIDTSPNVFETIDLITSLLRDGGVWINLGPLMYHYSDDDRVVSIQPTFQDIIDVVLNKLNYELIKEIDFLDCEYFYNQYSMQRYYFNCPFFAVRKK